MNEVFAKEFSEISHVLLLNTELRDSMLQLIEGQPMAGKVTEGGDRLTRFREILRKLVIGEFSLMESYRQTDVVIPRHSSIHGGNNRVFVSGWAERLVRTQYSRFYNQAVLEKLIRQGQSECFIHHSSEENQSSSCSQYLAGRAHDPHMLHSRLVAAFANGVWSKDLKVPEHPHCTHVVTPIE